MIIHHPEFDTCPLNSTNGKPPTVPSWRLSEFSAAEATLSLASRSISKYGYPFTAPCVTEAITQRCENRYAMTAGVIAIRYDANEML